MVGRVLVNSKFGVFYSNFLSLTPTFCRVSIEKYSKTPTFSGRQHFYSYFQNPSENSGRETSSLVPVYMPQVSLPFQTVLNFRKQTFIIWNLTYISSGVKLLSFSTNYIHSISIFWSFRTLVGSPEILFHEFSTVRKCWLKTMVISCRIWWCMC